jgi:hypothetical protein
MAIARTKMTAEAEQAVEAEARLQELMDEASGSWATALRAALYRSREAFDEASQKAWDTLERLSAEN